MIRLGILSDTHDSRDNTIQALKVLVEQGVERLIHCGDITRPATASLFEGWPIDFVYGNMDGDPTELEGIIGEIPGASIATRFTAEIDGVRIGACHGDDKRLLREMIRSGLYNYVFHGHTHRRRDEQIGTTRVINPGAVGGMRHQTRSVCVLDLTSGEITFHEFGD
jgi:putative phosphoesterase